MAHSTTTVQKESSGGHESAVARKGADSAPVHPLLAIQRTAGNQSVQRLLRSSKVQAKLQVSQPGDKLEQEADRTADKVMRSPDVGRAPNLGISRMADEPQAVHRSSGTPLRHHPQPSVSEEPSRSPLREQPEPSRHFDPGGSPLREHPQNANMVQREAHDVMSKSEGPLEAPSGFESRLGASKSGGQPMPPETRTQFESKFGTDFGSVRVHTGAESDHLNRDVHAKAFTSGSHIYFAAGNYSPETPSGKTLLAHELTHVVQQGHADPIQRSTVHREASDEPDDRPTPEQRAIALAKAARAAKAAAATAGVAHQQIVKTRQEESKQLAAGKASAAKAAAHMAAKKKPSATKHRVHHAEPSLPPLPEQAAEGAAGGKKAPASAHEDPAFHKVAKRIIGVGRTQKAHVSGAKKADEAQAAAEMPAEERTGRAQDNQAGAVEKAQPAPFDAATLKSQLMKRIEEVAPHKLSEADEFKENNKLGGVKAEMSGKVGHEKSASAQPVKEKSDQPPDPSKVPDKPVVKLADPSAGPGPAGVGAAGAAPKQKTKDEVEAPIQENTKRVGDEMADANVTEKQLAKSNEPSFQEALSSKKSAETQAAQSTPAFRASEHQQIKKTEAVAMAAAASKTGAMHLGRGQSFGSVHGMQDATKNKDEAARRDVGQHIDGLYGKTKGEVDRILQALDGKVDKAFDEGAQGAKQSFEDYVGLRMDAYKDDRYGGWFGWARWADDKLFGMPDEVNRFYEEGRDLFINKMDAVLDTVVAIIAAELTAAKAEVAKGRKDIADYLAGLPENLKKVGAEAAENANSMFDSLEESVNSKAGELVDSLAHRYQDSLKAIDSRIEELKAANKGLVDKAIGAVKAVINALRNLKDLLFRVLAKIAQVIMDIIADPIGFLGNLMSALKMGLNNFIGRIDTHFKNAFITWLTGSMGSLNIKMPDDIFSVQGMFSLVSQILGLTWDYVRAKAVKMFGEPVVKAMETGFDIFQILIRDGPIGLWEFAKEKFGDLKSMVIEKIKEMLIEGVIHAGIKWLLGLMNPVAAFIKAAIAIYDLVMFFIEKATQIGKLIEAVIDAIAEVVKGNLGGAAKMVEDALANALSIVIGFLANLLGISGLVDKVQALFKSLRQRVDGFIDSVLVKGKNFAKKFLGKMTPEERRTKGPATQGADEEHDERWQVGAAGVQSELDAHRKEGLDDEEIKARIPAWKSKYRFTSLELTLDGDDYDLIGSMSPDKKKAAKGPADRPTEGNVGTYSDLQGPRGDKMTPDHEPQNALMTFLSNFTTNKFVGFRKPFADKPLSRYKMRDGISLNMYEKRHYKTRTYGGGGSSSKAEAIEAIRNSLKDLDPNSKVETVRKKVAGVVRLQLDKDHATVRTIYKDPKVPPATRDRVHKGLKHVESQNQHWWPDGGF